MAFDKFKGFLSKTKDSAAKVLLSDTAGKVGQFGKSAVGLGLNFLPLVAGAGFAFAGVYGLEAYLGIKFAKDFRDNLRKNKLLSEPIKDWYEMFGDKVLSEDEGKKIYEKMKNRAQGKISDENSVLAYWKNVYDK